MPILLVFSLAAACIPVDWPAPLVGGGVEVAVALSALAVGASLSVAVSLRRWVIRTLRQDYGRKIEVAQVYSRIRRLMLYVNLGLVAACVVAFGWGWAVQRTLVVEWHGQWRLAPFAELIVPLPYFLILFGTWTIYFDAERLMHRTTVLGPVTRDFFSRTGYFIHHLRQFVLLILLPVMFLVIQQSIARFLPATARSDWFRFGSFALIPLLILFLPLFIKPMLGLRSMPAGAARGRLETLARRLHFRCTDFLLWPTHGAVANAMILGLLPRVRYVIFTDRILEELPPDEIDAVFGHEVGHAKHGHIPLYAAFLLLSTTVLAAALLLIVRQLDAAGVELPAWAEGWIALPPVVLTGIYVFIVFGFLSRRCERQADVYGCRAVSCCDPACTGHDDSTVYPERAQGLCPGGIRTFVRALERVEYVNSGRHPEAREQGPTLGGMVRGLFRWLRAWQHSTIPRRIAFLQDLIGRPERERRFQRRVTILRWALLAGLVAVLIALGEAVGWDDLLQSM